MGRSRSTLRRTLYYSRSGPLGWLEKTLSQSAKRPIPTLQRAINKRVAVRLKSDLEYRGRMSNCDPYMNVILLDAEEYDERALAANYGKVVIRGNNVLFIKIEDAL
jgi:small nuclear ribonucleoprotein